jgi:glycosyltransferase involved in cell wall biosynthesis
MTIAVNAVTPAFKPAAGKFFQHVFLQLAAAHPQHQFILIGFDTAADGPKNCVMLQPGKTVKSPLRFLYWLNYQLPSLLKKNNAEVLFSYNSGSQRLQLPQFLYTDDLSFLKHPEFYNNRWLGFYKKNTPKFLQKARHVITASLFLKNEITEHYKIPGTEISIVYAAADAAFKPAVHWNMKEAAKEKIAGGKEFFLYTGNIHTNNNLINLLKAFSFFKQRQKSNMLLVLASEGAAEAAFVKSLSSYKYRAEVVLAENIGTSELSSITAAAYALINPAVYNAAATDILQALQCATPVIVAGTCAMPEICGEAAAYCNTGDFNDIAAKMMLLFTNEDRRSRLIATGRDRVAQFDIGQSARQLWQLVQPAEKA